MAPPGLCGCTRQTDVPRRRVHLRGDPARTSREPLSRGNWNPRGTGLRVSAVREPGLSTVGTSTRRLGPRGAVRVVGIAAAAAPDAGIVVSVRPKRQHAAVMVGKA